MNRSTRAHNRAGKIAAVRAKRGFTLIELLVVLLIILLVSAAALPTIITGLRQRQISEAGRIFQAGLAGARDAAIASNAPRGIRLLPDPMLTQPPVGTYATSTTGVVTYTGGNSTWACNRFVPIETGPDYREGRVTFYQGWFADTNYSTFYDTANYGPRVLFVMQAYFDIDGTSPAELTSWAWNLRVGDRLQFEPEGKGDKSVGSGHVYTVVGPVVTKNPENFINYGDSGPPTPNSYAGPAAPEFLLLVNGTDDNADGFVDNGYDGVTSGFETERWLGAQYADASMPSPPIRRYVVRRRPVPAKGARETLLPSNVVVDLTSWNKQALIGTGTTAYLPERSRLPIDGTARYIDVLMDPSGQVIPTTAYSSPSAFVSPFLHFWLTDREGVIAPDSTITSGGNLLLPLPAGTSGYTPTNGQYLQGERMLITLFTRTGNLAINSLQTFDATPSSINAIVNTPFYAAQRGEREAP